MYLDGESHVLKINDAIYYATCLKFFNSLLLHNLIFPNTAYLFVGFFDEDDILYAVVRQPFIATDSQAEFADIKKLLDV